MKKSGQLNIRIEPELKRLIDDLEINLSDEIRNTIIQKTSSKEYLSSLAEAHETKARYYRSRIQEISDRQKTIQNNLCDVCGGKLDNHAITLPGLKFHSFCTPTKEQLARARNPDANN